MGVPARFLISGYDGVTFFLQMIASHFEWIHGTMQSLGRDGKEMFWRVVCEGPAPETKSFPEGVGYRYTYRHVYPFPRRL